MSDRFEVYRTDIIPHVGQAVLVLGIIKPEDTAAISVESHLVLRPSESSISHYRNAKVDNVATYDPLEVAPGVDEDVLKGFAIARARHAVESWCFDAFLSTKDPALMEGVTLHEAGVDLLRDMWVHADEEARERIWELKGMARCKSLKQKLGEIEAAFPPTGA